jgi:serine protease Do
MRAIRFSPTIALVFAVMGSLITAHAGEQREIPLSLTLPASPGQTDPELARISRSLVRLAESLRPALVQVRRTDENRAADPPDSAPSPDRERPPRGLGSGFIVSPDGHLITNHHVVRGASRVEVRLRDGRRFPAQVLGSDARTDLAVLKVDGVTSWPVMALGDSDALEVGELVMALGNPFGFEQSVSLGIISRKPSRPGVTGPGFQFIQTDAAVNPGNSGGPLVNMAGEVVGVNSMATSRGSIGFAIPSRVVQSVAPVLATGTKMRWGWLGVVIGDIEETPAPTAGPAPAEGGALIRAVRPGNPAARAGVRVGDIIVELNGVPVREPRDLQEIVASLSPGKRVPVLVLREGRRESVTVEVGEAPDEVQ